MVSIPHYYRGKHFFDQSITFNAPREMMQTLSGVDPFLLPIVVDEVAAAAPKNP
jgi:hypothetical protein